MPTLRTSGLSPGKSPPAFPLHSSPSPPAGSPKSAEFCINLSQGGEADFPPRVSP